MGRNSPYVITPEAFDELKRMVLQQRHEISSLRNRLASVAVRRHQGGFTPPRQRVKFYNGASETAPAYAVMAITSGTADTYYTIGKPDTTFRRLYLVNDDVDVPQAKTGWGRFLCDTTDIEDQYALYESGTPAIGESWGPANGQWSLKKWRYGFTVIGANETTELRTVVVQHQVNTVYGQTNGTIAKAGSGTVDLYDGNNSAISSTSITATNRFADVATTKKVLADWIGGTWLLSAAECG